MLLSWNRFQCLECLDKFVSLFHGGLKVGSTTFWWLSDVRQWCQVPTRPTADVYGGHLRDHSWFDDRFYEITIPCAQSWKFAVPWWTIKNVIFNHQPQFSQDFPRIFPGFPPGIPQVPSPRSFAFPRWACRSLLAEWVQAAPIRGHCEFPDRPEIFEWSKLATPVASWLMVWNMNFIFHFIYGMSSFPLTNSYLSWWLKPTC